ncbi:related to insulysin precursor (metalloendopeptidase) [Fusarium fujikuroi]|nr:related to insulysin precursor (metalloendopeptidase) [Fusarium fujikuroi]
MRDKFIEFHARHYSANRMNLVVLGREPLGVLKKWVAELSSLVVNKRLPPNRWPGELPFRETGLVISLGMKAFGSIMSYIKSKGWVNGLSAGAYPVCLDTPGIFDVQVRLTEEGFKNYPESSRYIPKGMAEVEFKFKQKTLASSFTSRISSVMQKSLLWEWLPSGHSRLREFALDEIEKALATIRSDNFRMSIASRNYPGNWDQKEKKQRQARLLSDLVRDALEEYSYDAELAGLQYNVSLDSCGLFLDVSGYNDKLPLLLEQVVTTMRDLNIKKDRFEIVRERLIRGCRNWKLQSSYYQVGDYTNWLNVPERDFLVEELVAELPNVFVEVHVHGNLYKEDALKATNMVESILKPRDSPKAQWPILRSLVLTNGFNFVFRKTLKDPTNVSHGVETWFYVGSREDRDIRTKTLFSDQMLHEPAFDQLRTKKQLGYIVFSGPLAFSTTYGFRFIIQSEMTPDFLDSRIEASLMRYADTLEKMGETEFEGHKRSLIVRRLEKLRNLDQESTRHWNQITNEYYDFELGKAEGIEKRQEEAQKKADEEPSPGDAVKTAEEITDVRHYKAGLAASLGARPVKDINEYEDTDVKL